MSDAMRNGNTFVGYEHKKMDVRRDMEDVYSDNCVILAIPAFVGWIIPYFAFKRVKKNKTEKVTPVIDNHYEEIFDICKEANGLRLGGAIC